MKFFHLSDLHIGLKLMNRDLREDQEYILDEITELARRERPDAVVIAGDIYDKAVPSAEAVEVFDRFLVGLTEAVPDAVIMMISGNHDSAPRVNCFRKVLSGQNIYMVGQPPRTESEYIEKVTLNDAYGEVNFYLLPFVKPSMVKTEIIFLIMRHCIGLSIVKPSIRTREMCWSVISFISRRVKRQKKLNVWILRCAPSEILMRYLRMCWEILIMQHSDTSTNQ